MVKLRCKVGNGYGEEELFIKCNRVYNFNNIIYARK